MKIYFYCRSHRVKMKIELHKHTHTHCKRREEDDDDDVDDVSPVRDYIAVLLSIRGVYCERLRGISVSWKQKQGKASKKMYSCTLTKRHFEILLAAFFPSLVCEQAEKRVCV